MKRTIALCITFLLAITLFSSCGPKNQVEKKPTNTPRENKTELSVYMSDLMIAGGSDPELSNQVIKKVKKKLIYLEFL